jgi:hypothetical protein
VVTLDELLDSGTAKHRSEEARRQTVAAIGAGFYWFGWLLFKLFRFVLLAIGGVFWSIGWAARRIVWPACVWVGAAVKLGWEDGRRGGGARVVG